jgi:peptide/nickel transport system substrate-binding protein
MALMGYTPGTADLVPAAAADFAVVSDDGKTYTYTLKEGIQFADGTPLTADDFVYSWNRLNTLEGQVSGLVQVYVESVEAPDAKTVVYHLKNPIGFFNALAATAPFVPVNPKTFTMDKIVAFPDKLDGVGPYRMVSNVPGEQLVLKANPNYKGEGKPIIPNVIIKYFADPTTMGNAVEKGEIDIAWRILGSVESTRLQSVKGLTVQKIDAPTLRYMVFNHTYGVAAAE